MQEINSLAIDLHSRDMTPTSSIQTSYVMVFSIEYSNIYITLSTLITINSSGGNVLSPFVFHNFSQITYFSLLNIFKMTYTIAIKIKLRPRLGRTRSRASPPMRIDSARLQLRPFAYDPASHRAARAARAAVPPRR